MLWLDLCHLIAGVIALSISIRVADQASLPALLLCRPLLAPCDGSLFPLIFNPWALGVFIIVLYVPCAFLLGWQIGITLHESWSPISLIEQSTPGTLEFSQLGSPF